MRFLLDANLPRMAVSVIAGFGHDVSSVRDIGLGDATDAQIAAHARKTSTVIVTRDLDFADIREYPPEEYSGIVVIRLPDDATARDITRVLSGFLSQPRLVEQIEGHLAIVESRQVRFRPRLIQGNP